MIWMEKLNELARETVRPLEVVELVESVSQRG